MMKKRSYWNVHVQGNSVNFQQIKVAVKMAEISILKKHPTPTLLPRLELVTRHQKTLENFLSRSRSSPGGAFCSVISNTCCTSTVVFIIISYGCSIRNWLRSEHQTKRQTNPPRREKKIWKKNAGKSRTSSDMSWNHGIFCTFMGGYFEKGAWPWASSNAVIPNDQISALQRPGRSIHKVKKIEREQETQHRHESPIASNLEQLQCVIVHWSEMSKHLPIQTKGKRKPVAKDIWWNQSVYGWTTRRMNDRRRGRKVMPDLNQTKDPNERDHENLLEIITVKLFHHLGCHPGHHKDASESMLLLVSFYQMSKFQQSLWYQRANGRVVTEDHQQGVPTNVFLDRCRSPVSNMHAETPKSPSFTAPFPSTRIFPACRSPWTGGTIAGS